MCDSTLADSHLFASLIEEVEHISYVPKPSRITLPSHLVTLEDSNFSHHLRLLYCAFALQPLMKIAACDYVQHCSISFQSF